MPRRPPRRQRSERSDRADFKKELAHWVAAENEQSRFRALGEMSALIVHDLSAPLHVLHFCTQEIKERPEVVMDPKYLEQLEVNGARALELVDSLRSYLKRPEVQEAETLYGEAHDHVVRLLEGQYLARGYHRVRMEVDPRLRSARLKIRKADFIHVWLNLLANSFENLLRISASPSRASRSRSKKSPRRTLRSGSRTTGPASPLPDSTN